MKLFVSIFLVIVLFGWYGCTERLIEPDLTPPVLPQGIATATGDNLIELFWSRNTEADLAGYNVYVGTDYGGKYLFIGATTQPYFIDRGAKNGVTYFYAISAFDFAGNESDLSLDVAYDTPRPEGYGVDLNDYRTNPDIAGYDFSTYTIGPYDDKYTDIFFEYYQGRYYLNVWTDSDIQDMGYTKSLYEIGAAPTGGWSPTKDVPLIAGHTYVVWTWDDHYAKLRVKSVSPSRIVFDWAYQLAGGNTRLKGTAKSDRGFHRLGDGIKHRQ